MPRIPYLDKLRSDAQDARSSDAVTATPAPKSQHDDSTSSRPRRIRQDSLSNDPESDPWASPAAQRPVAQSGHAHTSKPNGIRENGTNSTTASLPQRTTSTFTTYGESPSENGNKPDGDASSSGAGWNAYNGNSSEGFSEQPSLVGGGFGGDSGGRDDSGGDDPRRSVGASVAIPHTGEIITVTMLPEKEGLFMFQHRNYEVKSTRRSSSVVRRYSDFVWLLDCLQKRYPFRRLPLLPPKRVQGEHFYDC